MFKKKKSAAHSTTTKKEPTVMSSADNKKDDLNSLPERTPSVPVKNPVVRSSDYVFNATRRKSDGGGDTKKLVVGPEIKLTGEIASCDKLIVEGEVEADLTSAYRLEISQDGRFQGHANVETADIAGEFEGTLEVTDLLILRKSARIKGTIHYEELQVERGAEIFAKVEKRGGQANMPQQPPLSLRSYDDPKS